MTGPALPEPTGLCPGCDAVRDRWFELISQATYRVGIATTDEERERWCRWLATQVAARVRLDVMQEEIRRSGHGYVDDGDAA